MPANNASEIQYMNSGFVYKIITLLIIEPSENVKGSM